MKRIAVIIILAMSAVEVTAQPDTLWTRIYGRGGSDFAYSIQQTTDGGYVVAGSSISLWEDPDYSHEDFYVVKTDGQGDTLWTRTYGGSDDDQAFSIQQTTDGGYVVAGWTDSFGAGSSRGFYVVKTDAQGDTLWTRTYGGSDTEEAASVQQTTDGGYVIAGTTHSSNPPYSEFYVVKTDAQGDTLWTRTYGGSQIDQAHSIQQTTDGGYVIAGYTSSFGVSIYDFWLVKTDAQGNPQWTRTYGGSDVDLAYSIQQTTDGGYVLAGSTSSFGAVYDDFYVVKTDGQGDTLWTRTYGGSDSEAANSIQQTADGGYVVAGYAYSFDEGDYNFYVVKTDGQGDTLWTRTYGGSDNDYALSIQQTTDGGYVVAGYSNSFGAGGYDFYVVKTRPDGPSPPLPVDDLVAQWWNAPLGIRLTWDHVTQDSAGNPLTGRRYVIYRNTSTHIVPLPADSIGGTTDSTFTDPNPFGTDKNFYRVRVKSL